MNKSEPIRSLESIDLSSCTILDKNFSGVKFNGASFRGTRFDNVDFTGATFANCDFTECRMTDCQLDHAQAHMTDFSLVIFENCSVANMQMRECQMEAVSPYSTDLSDIDMDDATQDTRTDQEQDVDDMLCIPCWILSMNSLSRQRNEVTSRTGSLPRMPRLRLKRKRQGGSVLSICIRATMTSTLSPMSRRICTPWQLCTADSSSPALARYLFGI